MAAEPTSDALARKIFWILIVMCVGYAASAYLLVR